MRGVFDFFEEYDIIKLEGKFIEKFFNIATKKKIKIWNIRYIGKSVVVFSCYRKDYNTILAISDKASTKLYIMNSKGVMHRVKKYKNRISVYLCAVFMVLVIVLLSNTVCVINIKGNNSTSQQIILEQLKKSGLEKGMFADLVDIESVQKKMLSINSELAWIGISINGAVAEVEIAEKAPKPYIVDKDVPCNILASKDGVIEEFIVKDGFPVAKNGDTVKKGQMLVSGVNESKQGDLMLVHSMADVKIRTWNYLTKTVPLTVAERIPNGVNKSYYSISFWGKELNLFLGEKPDQNKFNIAKTESEFGNLPISFIKKECEGINIVNKKYTPEQILNINKKSMYDEVIASLDKDSTILNTEYNFTEDGENITIDLCVVAIENAAIEQIAKY